MDSPVVWKAAVAAVGIAVVVGLLWIAVGDIRFLMASGVRSPNAIHVVAATYGENCLNFRSPSERSDPVTIGNATVFASQSCNNTDVFCPVYVDNVKVGEPARGCAKDFSISWRCGTEAALHHNHLPAEALGYVLWIGCPAQDP